MPKNHRLKRQNTLPWLRLKLIKLRVPQSWVAVRLSELSCCHQTIVSNLRKFLYRRKHRLHRVVRHSRLYSKFANQLEMRTMKIETTIHCVRLSHLLAKNLNAHATAQSLNAWNSIAIALPLVNIVMDATARIASMSTTVRSERNRLNCAWREILSHSGKPKNYSN